MRSPYTLAACLVAIRFEIGDMQFAFNRQGLSNDEMSRLAVAIEHLKVAEENLKAFRFIKKVEDLPQEPKPKATLPQEPKPKATKK